MILEEKYLSFKSTPYLEGLHCVESHKLSLFIEMAEIHVGIPIYMYLKGIHNTTIYFAIFTNGKKPSHFNPIALRTAKFL